MPKSGLTQDGRKYTRLGDLGGNPRYPDIKRLVVGGPKGKSMVLPLIMGQRRKEEVK